MNKQRRLGRVALQLYHDIDPMMREAATSKHATCTRGCAHCCHLFISVYLPEALAIAEYLLSVPERINDVLAKIGEQAAVLADPQITRASYFEGHHPCVFLKDNQCTIYNVRPGSCRLYYAVTPPENCGAPDGHTTVASINTEVIEDTYMKILKKECESAGLRLLLAPLQILVPLAITYLRDGRKAFEAACKDSQLSYWTDMPEGTPYYEEAVAFVKGRL